MTKHPLSLLSAAAVLALLVQPATAQPPAHIFLARRLTGDQEVPPRVTSAHAEAVFRLNLAGTELRFEVTASGLRNLVGGHVHSGVPGVNGPIVFGFFGAPPGGGRFKGIVARGTIVRGVTPLPPSLGAGLTNAERFDALIALLRSGNAYINLHTNDGIAPTNTGAGDFPGGEIRTQIIPKP